MNNFLLLRDWDLITSHKNEIQLPEARWKLKWGIDSVNAQIMYNALQLIQPSIIIETGTFEGHGCAVMAQSLAKIGKACVIHTIDYDGDPLTNESAEEWKKLRVIREENLEMLKKAYPMIEIQFHDGDSRQVLPKLMASGMKWDFFFQDSMHFYEGIKSEWDVVKFSANNNAVAVFDDISLSPKVFSQDGRIFCERFVGSQDATKWNYISTTIGHHQFWIQRK